MFSSEEIAISSPCLQILQALDIGPQLFQEVNELGEICFWNPGQDGMLERTGRIPDVRLTIWSTCSKS